MSEEEVSDRLTRLELAVAHLTEALEELAGVLSPAGTSSTVLVKAHLRDIRENFNRFVPKGELG